MQQIPSFSVALYPCGLAFKVLRHLPNNQRVASSGAGHYAAAKKRPPDSRCLSLSLSLSLCVRVAGTGSSSRVVVRTASRQS